MSYEAACEAVYGMPYADYKKSHQKKATPEQLALYEASKPLHAQHPKPAPAPAPSPSPQPSTPCAPQTPPSGARKSTYPMTDVDDALAMVLEHTEPLSAESVPASGALGRVLRDDVSAVEPLPPFAA